MTIFILVVGAFFVGAWCGYSLYAWTFGQLILKGRAYVKDKHGHWHPANPFRQ